MTAPDIEALVEAEQTIEVCALCWATGADLLRLCLGHGTSAANHVIIRRPLRARAQADEAER